jgi:aspartate kinase
LRDDLPVTLAAVGEAARQLGAEAVVHDDEVAKVSAVGLGMARQTGVAERMFRALADNKINIQMITTSEIKISVLVARDDAAAALRVTHRAFGLDKPPAPSSAPLLAAPAKARDTDAAAVVARLQGMEDLAIDDIALDDSQARVTIVGVPDSPGVAARVFEQVAAGGIFVDMIVQSCSRDGRATLTFTTPQAAVDRAVAISSELAAALGCQGVTSAPQVAKLSVSGIGMRSHTGVAIRMFRSLAEAGINVEMINTSEVRVNVVVAGNAGRRALDCLQKAFSDAQR